MVSSVEKKKTRVGVVSFLYKQDIREAFHLNRDLKDTWRKEQVQKALSQECVLSTRRPVKPEVDGEPEREEMS